MLCQSTVYNRSDSNLGNGSQHRNDANYSKWPSRKIVISMFDN